MAVIYIEVYDSDVVFSFLLGTANCRVHKGLNESDIQSVLLTVVFFSLLFYSISIQVLGVLNDLALQIALVKSAQSD